MRVIIVSDLHCGHIQALAPKRWNDVPTGGRDIMQARKRLWRWWEKEVKALDAVDILLCNGDLIDGRGFRSGSTELLTADLDEQVAMAAECLQNVKRQDTYCTYLPSLRIGVKPFATKNQMTTTCKSHLPKSTKLGKTPGLTRHRSE